MVPLSETLEIVKTLLAEPTIVLPTPASDVKKNRSVVVAIVFPPAPLLSDAVVARSTLLLNVLAPANV
jgi:hypothetical protein